jgi:hypothetical protein
MPNVFVAWRSTEIHFSYLSYQNIPIARAMKILLSDWLNRQNNLINRPVILITVNHTEPEDGGTMFLRELQKNSTRQYGVTSKKKTIPDLDSHSGETPKSLTDSNFHFLKS